MPVTAKVQYALRSLVSLGMHSDRLVKIHEIAEEEDIPTKFLEQILLHLKRAGWVTSKQGAGGGYTLKVPAENIRLGAVVRQFDGPLAPISCVSQTAYQKCTCPDEERCGLRTVWGEVRDSIAEVLDNTTLEEVCDRTRRLRQPSEQKSLVYHI